MKSKLQRRKRYNKRKRNDHAPKLGKEYAYITNIEGIIIVLLALSTKRMNRKINISHQTGLYISRK
jgi:hypothetical protein